MVPERHNKVKVLLLMDVGGTMDEHIHRVEELFSAAKTEFKHLEFYYFHNCVYDFMWKNNRRRYSEKFSTWDLIRKYNKDYKLIFVGDATMSPYEILQPGGSVEYNNEEPGAEWLQRLTNAFPKFAWINPEPQGVWGYRQSISVIQQLMNQRMFPLTLPGLEGAMRLLVQMTARRSAAARALSIAAAGGAARRLRQPALLRQGRRRRRPSRRRAARSPLYELEVRRARAAAHAAARLPRPGALPERAGERRDHRPPSSSGWPPPRRRRRARCSRPRATSMPTSR